MKGKDKCVDSCSSRVDFPPWILLPAEEAVKEFQGKGDNGMTLVVTTEK